MLRIQTMREHRTTEIAVPRENVRFIEKRQYAGPDRGESYAVIHTNDGYQYTAREEYDVVVERFEHPYESDYRVRVDSEDIERIRELESEGGPGSDEAAAYEALAVLTFDPMIRGFLEQNQPKALQQAERARAKLADALSIHEETW